MMTQMHMRDPFGNLRRYRKEIGEIVQQEEFISSLVPESLEEEAWFRLQFVATTLRLVVRKYVAGEAIESIKDMILDRADLIAENSDFVRLNGIIEQRDYSAIDGKYRADTAFVSMALLSVETSEYLSIFRKLLPTDSSKRSYVIDLLVKAFVPDHAILKKYKTDRYAVIWTDPFLRALAADAETRSEALATYMKNWCRMMRPFGWKPDLNTEPGKDRLFCDFAFEVALAVCAYDIDDSMFCDHAYYPRDLVQHYRAQVRNTRDAWRPMAVGPGVQVIAPPPPKKADLAKTKRKGIARWIELVCDGNVDATESVLEVIGKPRKLEDIHELMEALSDAGQAIHGDVKDDETILIQAASMADERALGEFDGPAGPPFGPARCSAGLLAFSAWLETRGYRLVDLDNDDDAWHAVVVKADYHAELIDLSNTLKIRTRTPEAVYND
jgi:hypothetical protein